MNENSSITKTVESVASEFVSTYKAQDRAKTAGAVVAKAIAELFVTASAAGCFDQVFSTGKAGELRTAVLEKAKKARIANVEALSKTLKVRLSEARRLYRLGGIPQKGEDIQAALKRYAKEKAPKPEGNSKAFSIPEELGADALADALSLWLAKQTPAKQKAFSADLKDFLPAPTRTRAPAKKAA